VNVAAPDLTSVTENATQIAATRNKQGDTLIDQNNKIIAALGNMNDTLIKQNEIVAATGTANAPVNIPPPRQINGVVSSAKPNPRG
jgi:hypothetical protein